MRLNELKMIELNKSGAIPGHVHSGLGQEGAYSGVLATGRKGDYYKFTHRAVPACHAAGVSSAAMYGEVMGKATGSANGLGGPGHVADGTCGVLGTSGAVGCDTTISIGAALSARQRHDGSIVYSYYGDGTSSRGPVHEAMNMAGALNLPVLFVCVNNEIAISTKASEAIAVDHPGTQRATSYSMPSRLVDGTDILAVYDAAKKLTTAIRRGEGPAVLEVMCKRWRSHFESAASSQAVIPPGQICCLTQLEQALLEKGVLTKEACQAMRSRLEAEIDQAVAAARQAPLYDVSKLMDQLCDGGNKQ